MALAPVPSPAPAPGAIPPQNLEAEESVLGAMMISPLAIAAVSEIVDASDFYRESHAKIYRAALALYSKNEPVDAITLTNELEQRGELEEVGGRVRLHELSLIVPASANAGHYAAIVRETATLRGLIRAGGEIAQLGWNREGDPTELVTRAERVVSEITERRARAGQLEAQTWAEFERDATEHIPLLIDELWPEGGLGFVAAPPKKGKTWVGLDLAVSVATGTPFLGRFDVDEPAPVVYAALEGHKAAIRGRIGCLTRGHGANPSMGATDLQNLHLLYKPPGINLVDPAWIRQVHDLTTRLSAKLIVVDVLRGAAVLKENSNDEFRDLVRALQPITTSGCAIALLHHFGKLTEISRDRSPGERMSGAGAMYGAFDVGVFITGSDEGGRALRVEFETRDLPAPDLASVYLEGDPTGPNGGFIFTDKAWWIERDNAPDRDDVKAPAEEIAEYVRANGDDVERRIVEAYFEINPDTLTKRLPALRRLGVELIVGRGRGAKSRLVAAPLEVEDTQLDLLEESSGFSSGPVSPGPEENRGRNKEPHEQAKTGLSSGSTGKVRPDGPEETESADLQGDFSSVSSGPLRGQSPLTADAAPAPVDTPAEETADDIDWGTH